eukprot:Lithocolla_globosa_v1_NODE_2777_length_1871_cov_14.307269.p1 type:complete len:200 gc:universal NODE_2777_length_1871_cov_14.307269:161-760(+)
MFPLFFLFSLLFSFSSLFSLFSLLSIRLLSNSLLVFLDQFELDHCFLSQATLHRHQKLLVVFKLCPDLLPQLAFQIQTDLAQSVFIIHVIQPAVLRNVCNNVLLLGQFRNGDTVVRRENVFHFLLRGDVHCDDVSFAVTMFARCGPGHFQDFARFVLQHHHPSFSQLRDLCRNVFNNASHVFFFFFFSFSVCACVCVLF